jgi:hypothetical protein
MYQNATASFYTKNSIADQHSCEQSSLNRSLKHTQTLASRRQESFGQSVSQSASQVLPVGYRLVSTVDRPGYKAKNRLLNLRLHLWFDLIK